MPIILRLKFVPLTRLMLRRWLAVARRLAAI